MPPASPPYSPEFRPPPPPMAAFPALLFRTATLRSETLCFGSKHLESRVIIDCGKKIVKRGVGSSYFMCYHLLLSARPGIVVGLLRRLSLVAAGV
ncbi:unnamed protein product [Pieris brassicae]|uniref:Uncharacterized protein n=1 Tax=Pieris brassicae TaxID=7116 RepID=A0A9P0TTS5_PIEBR|nr:unnamed protein product [Pieris brassicae]